MSLTPETRESLESLKESNRKDDLLEEVKKASVELPELKEITSDSTKGEIIQAVEAALKNAADAEAEPIPEAEAADDQPAEAVEASDADADAAEQPASEDVEAIAAASEADAAEELCECGEQPKGECEKEACLLEDESAEAAQAAEAERALNNLVDALNETKPLRRRAESAGPFNRVLRR